MSNTWQRVLCQGNIHLPGPAVTIATPIPPDKRATASAANTALTLLSGRKKLKRNTIFQASAI